MKGSFQLVAGSLALDFVNTLDYRYDRERRIDLLPDYESFLEFSNQAGTLTGRNIKRLCSETNVTEQRSAHKRIIEFREALYSLLLSIVQRQRPRPAHLTEYNQMLLEASVPNSVEWRDHRFVLSFDEDAKSPFAPVRPILRDANLLLTSKNGVHIGECRDLSCRWLFLDHSKNHSRRWCSMEICGSRSKARTYYAHVRKSRSHESRM